MFLPAAAEHAIMIPAEPAAAVPETAGRQRRLEHPDQ